MNFANRKMREGLARKLSEKITNAADYSFDNEEYIKATVNEAVLQTLNEYEKARRGRLYFLHLDCCRQASFTKT